MADVHDKITRSFNMSRIRGRDTKPELLIRRYLHSKGFRYRVNVTNLPGQPDIVFPKYKTVVFGMGMKDVNTLLFQKQELIGQVTLTHQSGWKT